MIENAGSGGPGRGRLAEWIQRHGAYVLLGIPVIVSQAVGNLSHLAGESLVGVYLLRQEAHFRDIPFWFTSFLFCVDIVTWAVSFVFLWPLFKAERRRNQGRAIEPRLLLAARTRLYNFPALLIATTWFSWVIGYGCFILFGGPKLPVGPLVATALLSTIVNAVVVFYSADTLNRFLLIPAWFADGEFDVTFRLRSPSLALRFFDAFLVSGIFPVVAIAGTIAMTVTYGTHDPGELSRLLAVSAGLGVIFWGFGLFLTVLNAHTFISPLNAMARAAADLSTGNYDAPVKVHSDDQIGRLERSMNATGRALRERDMIKTLFGHYVSPAIRDLILDGKVKTDGDRIEAVVLFSDIRSFTQLSERYPPEIIVKLLNIHFGRVVDAVGRNNGFVDKFIGDAVMAVFVAEFADSMHRLCALKAAAEILAELEETNREIEAMSLPPISIGIGLACGNVIRGNVGSESRREMTVIGNTVNLASRLESASRDLGYPIIAALDAFDDSCAGFADLQVARRLPITVRGRAEPVDVLALMLR